METISALLSIVCAVVCSGFAGYFLALKHAVEHAKNALDDQVKTFALVTQKASEANNSIADQVITLTNKVKLIEDKVGMMAQAQQPRRPN